MKYTGKITDSHLHMHGGYTDTDGLYRGMERLGAEAGYTAKNVVMVPQWDAEFIGQNILGILYKALYPGRLFCYAGFDYYKPSGLDGTDLERQAREYAAMGFDGIKMVELKPTVYRNLGGVRLGGPRYDGMFSFLEESGMPVLLHMGDPETFWHRDRAPAFAVGCMARAAIRSLRRCTRMWKICFAGIPVSRYRLPTSSSFPTISNARNGLWLNIPARVWISRPVPRCTEVFPKFRKNGGISLSRTADASSLARTTAGVR